MIPSVAYGTAEPLRIAVLDGQPSLDAAERNAATTI